MGVPGKIVLLALIASVALAAGLDALAASVQEFTLNNGLRMVVLEREDTPIVSMHLRVNAGLADEPPGKSGVARVFETMYLRGGDLGSTNLSAEREALLKGEEWLDLRDTELQRGPKANLLTAQDYRLKARIAWESAKRFSTPFVISRAFLLNQFYDTGIAVQPESTDLTATVAANRAELWFKLTGDWLKRPSFRGFYEDRDALQQRLDEQGRNLIAFKLYASLFPVAFPNHPYLRVAGSPSDLESLRSRDAEEFWKKHYTARNMALAIVGALSPAAARRLAETHFGALPPGAPAPRPTPESTVPAKEVRVELADNDEAVWAVAWPRPGRAHPDDAGFDLLGAILDAGAQALLRRELIVEKQLALNLRVFPSWPGDGYSTLFAIFVTPAPGREFSEIESAVQRALGTLRERPVDEATLARARAWIRTSVLRQAETLAGSARLLVRASSSYGGVKPFAAALAALDKPTAADLQRQAAQYLSDTRRYVVWGGETRVVTLGGAGQ